MNKSRLNKTVFYFFLVWRRPEIHCTVPFSCNQVSFFILWYPQVHLIVQFGSSSFKRREKGENKGAPILLLRLLKRVTFLNTSYWLPISWICKWRNHFIAILRIFLFFFFLFFLSRWFRKLSCVGEKVKWKWKSLSCVSHFVTPWTLVHGILQAKILEWVAFPFSRESSQPRDWTQVSNPGPLFTSWATREAQEYWSG